MLASISSSSQEHIRVAPAATTINAEAAKDAKKDSVFSAAFAAFAFYCSL